MKKSKNYELTNHPRYIVGQSKFKRLTINI